jgi:Domain of unknown function (DUF5664)
MDKPSNPKDAIGIRKAPMSTVSAAVLAEVGVAMLEGAAKYGRHNYRAVGVQSSVYYDATMRHLMDWWEGVDTDPDSGMHHITKAIASLVVLRDAMIQGVLTDDRPPRSAEFYSRLNELAGAILDRHADKSPKHYTQLEMGDGLDPRTLSSGEPLSFDGDWIAWSGGPDPVGPSVVVECQSRVQIPRMGHAATFIWEHRGLPSDVVAYRVVST